MARHENYLVKYRDLWTSEVSAFLNVRTRIQHKSAHLTPVH
jgi:hypothetical protein